MSLTQWIQNAINPNNKGKLRKELGVKKGKKISATALKKAEKSKNPTVRKEARLAETLKKIGAKKKKKTAVKAKAAKKTPKKKVVKKTVKKKTVKRKVARKKATK